MGEENLYYKGTEKLCKFLFFEKEFYGSYFNFLYCLNYRTILFQCPDLLLYLILYYIYRHFGMMGRSRD